MLTYQKKGSVGYTAVGSPSIVDGVASGFSASNYLVLTQSLSPATTDKIEAQFSITTGSNIQQERFYFASRNNAVGSGGSSYGWRLGVYQNKIMTSGVGNANWSPYKLGITEIAPNESYKIKVVYENSTLKLFLRTGNDWHEELSEDNVVFNTFLQSTLGVWKNETGDDTYYWNGSIDLSETYIKVNGQVLFGTQVLVPGRVCLQGPVGYTVVGSPVIADGVVSGLDRDNYLRTNNEVTNLISGNFEMQVQYHTNTNAASGRLLSTGDALCNGLTLESGVFRFKARLADDTNYSWSTNYQVQGNTDYRVNAQRIGNVLTLRVYEGNTLVDMVNVDLTDVAFMDWKSRYRVGSYNFGGTIYGTIDLNNTYIKVNGKLWFGKQQANTVTCNHTTVWSHV